MPRKSALATALNKLRDSRLHKGLTLRDLEERVGVSRQALSAYERGVYPPKVKVWDKLKKVLGLDGDVEDYWGRLPELGRKRKYYPGIKCKERGCGRVPVSKGMCTKHYQRYHLKNNANKN